MGPGATRFALVFWMALAVVVIILASNRGRARETPKASRQRPFRRGKSFISRNIGKCFEDRQIVRGNPSLPHIGIGSIGADTRDPEPPRARHARAETVYDTVVVDQLR